MSRTIRVPALGAVKRTSRKSSVSAQSSQTQAPMRRGHAVCHELHAVDALYQQRTSTQKGLSHSPVWRV